MFNISFYVCECPIVVNCPWRPLVYENIFYIYEYLFCVRVYTHIYTYVYTHTHTHTHLCKYKSLGVLGWFYSLLFFLFSFLSLFLCMYAHIYMDEKWCTHAHISGEFNTFPNFFVQAFKIVVDSWKFSMLLLYIWWDDWPIFMISGSNEQLLTNMGIKTVPHPPYSPCLASCTFWLFPKLTGRRYETIEEMKEAVTKVIDPLAQEDFHGAFQKML